MSRRQARFKHFLSERNEFSKDGSETLLSVSEYYGVKPRSEAFEEERHESRADSLVDYRIVRKGDLVMNYMLAWKGAYGISQYDGIVSPAYSVFDVEATAVDLRFLHHRTRSRDMQAVFKQNSRGIMESRLRLYPDSLLSIAFDLPSLEVQEATSYFLDQETGRIDGLIEKKTRFIALLKEKRAAVITHAVTKGINPDVSMKDSGVEWLGFIPAHWVSVPIKHHVQLQSGYAFKAEMFGDTGTPLVRMSNLKRGELDLSDAVCIPAGQENPEFFCVLEIYCWGCQEVLARQEVSEIFQWCKTKTFRACSIKGLDALFL